MPLLVYNGTTYELTPEVAQALLEKGVVLPDPSGLTDVVLALEHLIDEVEPLATVVDRYDAPPESRLKTLKVRGTGWWPFPSAGYSNRGTIIGPEEADGRHRRR